MSVVSAKIDNMAFGFRKKSPAVAVQFDKNDSGSAEPPDFAIPPVLIAPRMVQGSLRPTEDTLFKGGYVPVCVPDDSVSVPFAVPSLDIESDVPLPSNAYDTSFISKFPDVPVEYPYSKGIRAGSRPIEFDTINEPTAMLFRKGKARQGANYDLGMDELRSMIKRQF